MPSPRSLLLTALVATGCATTPATPAGPPETVQLRFAPRPSTAQVDLVDARTTRVAGTEQVQRTSAHSTQRVLEVPEGFAYVDEDVRVETTPPNPVVQDLMAEIAERLQVVASPEGELTEIRGLDELQPAMLMWFDSVENEGVPPELVQQLRTMVIQATDPDRMLEQEASHWHTSVGIWHGKDLEIGRTYEVPEDGVTYRVAERVPCVAGEEARDCVRLQLTHHPSAEELEASQAAMQELLARQGDVRVIDVTSEYRVELVAKPETLEPHSMKKQRLVVTTLEEAGQQATIEREEVDTMTWRYE